MDPIHASYRVYPRIGHAGGLSGTRCPAPANGSPQSRRRLSPTDREIELKMSGTGQMGLHSTGRLACLTSLSVIVICIYLSAFAIIHSPTAEILFRGMRL